MNQMEESEMMGTSFSMMAKPAGAACNLACEYCYYLDKSFLYPGVSHVMTDETLERFVSEYISYQAGEAVMFIWHGGEALLRNREFYERALFFQRKYADGRHIDNCLQTNGTLITSEWCKFFKDNNFLIGLSIDGPQQFHDLYRRDRADNPTFLRVLKAARLLNMYDVDWNAMAVVNNANADYPLEFYRFFRDTLECRYLQFTPIVERVDNDSIIYPGSIDGAIAPYSVAPQTWGEFLCTIFDEWVRKDVGKMFVQLFDATLANWMGVPPGVCTMGKDCSASLVMEFNGDVYSCDHYVYPAHFLGNIADKPLHYMIRSLRHRKFYEESQRLPDQCLSCRYLFACHGECPKNRIVTVKLGHPRLNYLCEGYYKFFAHSEGAMRLMRNEILSNRAPSNIMNQSCL